MLSATVTSLTKCRYFELTDRFTITFANDRRRDLGCWSGGHRKFTRAGRERPCVVGELDSRRLGGLCGGQKYDNRCPSIAARSRSQATKIEPFWSPINEYWFVFNSFCYPSPRSSTGRDDVQRPIDSIRMRTSKTVFSWH